MARTYYLVEVQPGFFAKECSTKTELVPENEAYRFSAKWVAKGLSKNLGGYVREINELVTK